MSIFPLPMFEADADPSRRTEMTDAEVYARLKPPTSIVVRIGAMKHVAEYPYSGDAKPGCGSKLVARTSRGTEIVDMLTTTCANSGCGKSVSRQDMLEYIDNSGGHDYPFHTDGQILRVASIEDLSEWARVQTITRERVRDVKRIVVESGLAMKVVDLEPILGQELVTVYFMSEERVDFRDLVRVLAAEFHARIEMRQVGARDEARLVADYERCGQHCCCKNFLKVLKPVSMRSAKIQKATLDPLKISGRCGRLMCCLRYEDQTYEDLKKRLPRNKTRVGTSEGPGVVVDSKILVQLVLVQLDHDGREIAVPVEELLDPETCPRPSTTPTATPTPTPTMLPTGSAPADPIAPPDPLRGLAPADVARRTGDRDRADRRTKRRDEQQAKFKTKSQSIERQPPVAPPESVSDAAPPGNSGSGPDGSASSEGTEQKKRRRRRRRKGGDRQGDETRPGDPSQGGGPAQGREPVADDQPQSEGSPDAPNHGTPNSGAAGSPSQRSGEPRGRSRRRRRGGRGNGGGPSGPPPSET